MGNSFLIKNKLGQILMVTSPKLIYTLITNHYSFDLNNIIADNNSQKLKS
jgi:hypothetical protein